MNPVDDEAIDLTRDAQERFYGNGPFAMGPQTLWGLPRVVSEFVEEGTAWVADWSRAVIWDRQQSTISLTDSHADFFVRNLVAVLGERRLAFGVIRPPAFVKINLGGSGNGNGNGNGGGG
jgi:HK97 family phage major capsid protein